MSRSLPTRIQAAKLRGLRTDLPNLEVVAVMAWPREAGGQSVSELPLAVVTERGHARLMAEHGLARQFREATAALTADALATIIYTSGTTGVPKGVMLTHANLLSNVRALQDVIPLTSDDVALSFLPLSHSFERLVLYRYLFHGVTVAFAESLETIGRDLQAVRPTVMTGVPRVYEKIQRRILDNVAQAPPLRQRIFTWALGVGWTRALAELAHRPVSWHVALRDRLADRLVFSKIRARTGGRLRDVVSGSAPLGRETAQFFFSVGIAITEGYGLTETSPVLTVNPPAARRIGTVGKAIPGVTIRIAEDGEILARGPNIMQGYYQKPEATREVLRDGWFHTGDVGVLDADGYLTITDRKKDLIVTSGGKNVAPQPIEGLLKRDPLVAEAVLIGDRRRFIAALIAPNVTVVEQRLAAAGEAPPSLEQLVARPDVVALFQTVVDATNRDLSRFEQIKQFALLPVEFTIASGELTPTMKVRRRVIEERWRETIEALYGEDAVRTKDAFQK